MKKIKTKEMFFDEIQKDLSVVMFSADWCPDCVVIKPELPEIEASFPQYTFYFVDRDQFIELCQEYDIFGIPSFLVFKNGKEVDRFVSKNRKTKEEIEDFLKEAFEKANV